METNDILKKPLRRNKVDIILIGISIIVCLIAGIITARGIK